MRVGVQPKSYSSSNSNQSFSFNGYSEAYAKSIKEIRNVKNGQKTAARFLCRLC